MIWISPRVTRQIVRGGVILDQNFESEFRRTISKKKNHDCIVVWWKNIFFRKQKLKYTTVNVIIWCLCLCLNITTILLSFYSDFYAHSPIIRIRNMFLKNRHASNLRSALYWHYWYWDTDTLIQMGTRYMYLRRGIVCTQVIIQVRSTATFCCWNGFSMRFINPHEHREKNTKILKKLSWTF